MNSEKLHDPEKQAIAPPSETFRLLDSNSYSQTTINPTAKSHIEIKTKDDINGNSSTHNTRRIPNFVLLISLFLNVFLVGYFFAITGYAYVDDKSQTMNRVFHITDWIINITFQPLYESFSDIFGRRACLLTASGLFCLGCLWSDFANRFISQIFASTIMGIG
ncbi:hypothetical protein SPOG_05512 [Schizosaccharomyces cryophilus OY26]|uniref:Membrane transporter n=1 Tax=Schizosaccharomyces cryophilus (strain OY26 / ATCC MYA-4695 / CBS 11777 / NBRC 106824 / NRRL Y48691) TaxID=653667 RepID=S9W3Y0_SCHCR|nr:uncharacterized protein SPOG_05512 [Schizosaccharomyces cryophilus OY26]EPY53239.1 hypothetical protein SPOG_05512 [Schizosaccharomyces cryophilus OY26]